MAGVKEIFVTYDNGKIDVDPIKAHIYWEDSELPDTVNWIVKGCPKGLKVKIAWDLMAPFLLVEEIDRGSRVIGRVNTQENGVYEYSVLFVDDKGQITAGCDPEIINEPN